MRWKTVDIERGVWSLSRDGIWRCDYASEAEAKAVAEMAEKAHQQKGLD